MTSVVPRLRMFAGPNGSGKTTIKSALQRPVAWFGIYINADDLEATIRAGGFLPLEPYEIATTTDELRQHFASSKLLRSKSLHAIADVLVFHDGGISFEGLEFNSYHASVLADYLRRKSLEAGRSFSFETVMSAPDKVELLRDAQKRGFRTYLYYVATEDPEINIQRVKNRVAQGGHGVPDTKIVERYFRSLKLLANAIEYSNRAFLFDSSAEEPWYFAEFTDGGAMDLKASEIPNWFEPIYNQFRNRPVSPDGDRG